MSPSDRYIERLRRRLLVGEFLHVAAGWLAGFLLAFGAAVLAVKLFAPRYWPDVLWLGLLAVPVLGIAAWRTAKRRPSDRETVALLDQRLGAGGLLMSLAERPDPLWQQQLPAVETWGHVLPRVRPTRFAKAVAVPALFAVGAGFVPPREEPPPPPQATAGTDAAKELAETFELLEQADALDEETKQSLKTELEQLTEEAEDRPLTHEKWETVDALREQLRAGLDATSMSVSKGRSAAAALAAALTGGESLSIERTSQLNEELSEALETLRKNGAFDQTAGQSASGLPSELQRLLNNGDFKLPSDPAERRETLDRLKQLLDAEAKRLAEVRGECQQCLGGNGPPSDLFSLGEGNREGTMPGRGGVGRGRADAELSYGNESDEQAAKFRAAVLPPGFLDKPNETVLGVTASAPQVDPTAAADRNAARNSGPATGKTTWDRPLRPRHREVVRGYFGDP